MPKSPKKALLKEQANRDMVDWVAIQNIIPDPDEVLKKKGNDIAIYRSLRYEAHLSACVIDRKAGVTSQEWMINQGEAPAAAVAMIQDLLADKLDTHRLMNDILEAPLFGAQPIELMWSVVDGKVLPLEAIAKPVEWFIYGKDGDLRLRTKESIWSGAPLPDMKFLNPRHNPTYLNPYGERILAKCYWPVAFSKGTMKFWITFAEKYGMPFPVGHYPPGTSKDTIDEIIDMLERLITDGVAAVPSDTSVDMLESGSRGASSDLFDRFVEKNEQLISKAILGHSAAADSTPGKLGNEDQAGKVLDSIVQADQVLVQNTFNQLIRWVVDINFGTEVTAPTFKLYEEQSVDTARAERDEKLVAQGVRFTPDYYKQNYGLKEGDFTLVDPNEVATKPPTNMSELYSEFATKSRYVDQRAIDAMTTDPEAVQRAMSGVLKPVIDLVNESQDYNEVLKQLVGQYPMMDTEAIVQMLEQAIFVSMVWGRINA